MSKRVKVTITGFYVPEQDSDGYKGVEWPPNSGQHRDLTLVEDMAAYDEYQVDEDNMSLDEALDMLEDCEIKFVVEDDPNALAPGEGDNPFTDKDEAAGGGSKPSDEVTKGIDYGAGETAADVADQHERDEADRNRGFL